MRGGGAGGSVGRAGGCVPRRAAVGVAHGVRAGDNLAWNGTAWDNLAGIFTMDSIPTSDIDALFA